MCLIFIALNQHPVFKTIVATNRDEFYNRRTKAADFWEEHPEILGGRDLEAGGTWLGMTKEGKLSMVTNFRDPKNINPKAPSRGHLVSDYLAGEIEPDKYLKHLAPRASAYNGFNLITGTTEKLWYLSNYSPEIKLLTNGVYGLSNHLLDTPWPKVVKGRKKMEAVLRQSAITPQILFDVLYDDVVAPDELLPETGVGLERERILSSMFIKSPGYGTRCSTVILIDHQDQVRFEERVYDTSSFDYTTQTFEFKIQKSR